MDSKTIDQIAQMTNMNQNQYAKKKLLKNYRILKCWVPGMEKPQFRYALQQQLEVQVPVLDDNKPTGEFEAQLKWAVVGEGDKTWAQINAEHYGIEVPEEEYIIEDHQEEE